MPSSPRSHVNFRYFRTPDRQKRFKTIKAQAKAAFRKLTNLQKKIDDDVSLNGVELDEHLDQDIVSVMDECSEYVKKNYPDNSFEQLFWEEQKKARQQKNSKQMRWHPRWCLRIKLISSAAYNAFRSSGLLKLPSERTLRTTPTG